MNKPDPIVSAAMKNPTAKLVLLSLLVGCALTLLCFLAGCTIQVDKRAWVNNHTQVTNEVRTAFGGTVSIPTTAPGPNVTNTSDTQAEQAIDGKLSLPLLP